MTDSQLCQVSAVLPPYLRNVFPFQNFNRMQSQCLEAWNSDENLLIAAPTGSGKTVCFELAILRHIHKNLESSHSASIGTDGLSGKVVFIAPTKALCAEKQQDWQRRFRCTGLRVESITGDLAPHLSDAKLNNADLILTTAEKWDGITRNVGLNHPFDFAAHVSLLLLDEVHHIGESRGPTLESVVTRMLVSHDQLESGNLSSTTSQLRVIAVSATIGNTGDVGKWLRVGRNHIKVFDASYRPVSLDFKVFGYYIRNRWQAAKVYDSRILSIILKLGNGKPTLVFCTSRRQTAVSAMALVENLTRCKETTSGGANPLTRALSSEQRRKLNSSASSCRDKFLARLLASGVAIHNAEMNPHSRRLVESLFRASLILCLFSTSTLAQGVNLPARLVIIAGTSVYHDGELREYDRNIFMQMCGRAGRPGLDTKGVVAIMTSNTTTRLYQNIQEATPSDVESRLGSAIMECLNAEIARQFITDVPTAVSYLSSTFFWVQQKSKFVTDAGNEVKESSPLETNVAIKTIRELADSELLLYDEDRFGVGSTMAGRLMAKHGLSFPTMRHLMGQVSNASTPFQVLKVIASCSDVLENVVIRRSERKSLNQWKENLRFNIRGKVKGAEDKVIILLQMIMSGRMELNKVDYAVWNEAQTLLRAATRVCSCLMALVLGKAINLPYESLLSVLQVCRGLPNRTFWDGATVLHQIPGLNPKYVRELSKRGVSTIPMLAGTDRARINSIIGSVVPIGEKILEHLKLFPKFQLQTHAILEKSGRSGVLRVHVQVRLSSQIDSWFPKERRGERGFVLVGSHARGLIDIRLFTMAQNDHHFTFEIPRERDPRRRKWIDILVGSDRIVGVDEKDVIDCEEPPNARKGNERSSAVKNAYQQTSRLSVTNGRISKKVVQTTFPQALTRGFVKLKTLQPGSNVKLSNTSTASAEGFKLTSVGLGQQQDSGYTTHPSAKIFSTSAPDRDIITKNQSRTLEIRREYGEYQASRMSTNTCNVSNDGVTSTVANVESRSALSSELGTDAGIYCTSPDKLSGQHSIAREYDEAFRNLF
eukprot:GFKZ01005672.1.p1 GENE.GFKZ01005672.1~~GFKZ01005672.1.p1  ORF type:complete len:1051 (-),score=120.75 GFKZ01005672.1:1465-4617(-)